jgi:phospholipase D1/2
MGWTDVSISITGPSVQDLQVHFVNRWNFIYNEKYNVRKDARYCRLEYVPPKGGNRHPKQLPGQHDVVEGDHGLFGGDGGGFRERIKARIEGEVSKIGDQYGVVHWGADHQSSKGVAGTGVSCQLTRSLAKWSQGYPVEVSRYGSSTAG